MKRVKLLGIIVLVILVCLVFFSSTDKDITEDENNTRIELDKENVGIVINNGGSVLKYNGYIYYIDATDSEDKGFKNMLCRMKISDNSKEVIYYADRFKIDDRLIIFNNNIFFGVGGETYYVNLNDFNHFSEYNNGYLYYIGDGNIIYSNNNKIYKGTYYLKTLAIKSVSEIATLNPNYMFEDEGYLYFYSDNTDNSKSIISVSKKDQTSKILDRIYADENNEIEILHFEISKNYIYLILNNGMYQIRKISKDGSDINFVDGQDEIIGLYTLNDNFYFKISNSMTLYEYGHKDDTILVKDKVLKAPDVYTTRLVDNKIILYKNDEEIVSLLSDVESFSNIYIEEIEEYLYMRFDIMINGQRRILIFRVKNDGSNIEILNNI